jgi:hypothetical protein
MFKAIITNENANGLGSPWVYKEKPDGTPITYQEAQDWLAQQIGKPHRLPEREEQVIDENGEPVLDENGEIVMQTIPAEFTSEIVDITASHNDALNKANKILEGKKAREACSNVLDLVAGYNLANNLTAEQITSMMATFGSILQLLQANRPSTAKALIDAITPDEVIVTSQMKQDCLDLLSEY